MDQQIWDSCLRLSYLLGFGQHLMIQSWRVLGSKVYFKKNPEWAKFGYLGWNLLIIYIQNLSNPVENMYYLTCIVWIQLTHGHSLLSFRRFPPHASLLELSLDFGVPDHDLVVLRHLCLVARVWVTRVVVAERCNLYRVYVRTFFQAKVVAPTLAVVRTAVAVLWHSAKAWASGLHNQLLVPPTRTCQYILQNQIIPHN